MSKILFYRTCPRCNIRKGYLHENQLNKFNNVKDCKCCRFVPDSALQQFINDNLYFRECPRCHNLIKHNRRVGFLNAINENRICKSCGGKETFERKWGLEWKPIIGDKVPIRRVFYRIRKHWRTLSQEKKDELLSRTQKSRTMYFEHLPRAGRTRNRISVKKAFEKYKGENHWMKRPEVLRKVKNTCKKYRGDNHWSRRK